MKWGGPKEKGGSLDRKSRGGYFLLGTVVDGSGKMSCFFVGKPSGHRIVQGVHTHVTEQQSGARGVGGGKTSGREPCSNRGFSPPPLLSLFFSLDLFPLCLFVCWAHHRVLPFTSFLPKPLRIVCCCQSSASTSRTPPAVVAEEATPPPRPGVPPKRGRNRPRRRAAEIAIASGGHSWS
eukprot:Hpha_TRINITY_DN15969_c1_g1::TRINITY_DN15969_c1_g1_i2::g.70202::m.70202